MSGSTVQDLDRWRKPAPGWFDVIEGLRVEMAMFFLPALILDMFLDMMEIMMSSSEVHMPSRKSGKPTVIILE